MVKLSGVIISFNEEKNIERCLRSLVGVVDEIIVLDSFSTDKTEEVCKQFKVKFFQHKFDGHIEQKNRAISYALNDFVLSLDADEVLSDDLKESIIKVKEKPEFDAYYFNRLNFYCGKKIKYGGWYPDKKIRLWDKNKGLWGGVNPHDTVVLNKPEKKEFLKGDLLHYSFNTVEEHLEQVNKFSTISAEQLFQKKKKNLCLKAMINPAFRFFKNYFLKLGFLGGYTTFLISIIISFETFLKYSKAIQLKKGKKD